MSIISVRDDEFDINFQSYIDKIFLFTKDP